MNKKNKFFLKKIQYSALGSIIVLKHSLLHDSVPNIYVLASRKYIYSIPIHDIAASIAPFQ